jgi:hypothetical protein
MLGRCLLTIISEILFRTKGFVQIITQGTYLVIGSGHKVDSRGNFRCFRDVICLTIFSTTSSQKRDFQIYYTNFSMFTIKSLPFCIACHDSLDP